MTLVSDGEAVLHRLELVRRGRGMAAAAGRPPMPAPPAYADLVEVPGLAAVVAVHTRALETLRATPELWAERQSQAVRSESIPGPRDDLMMRCARHLLATAPH
jgi:hypothetical protein